MNFKIITKLIFFSFLTIFIILVLYSKFKHSNILKNLKDINSRSINSIELFSLDKFGKIENKKLIKLIKKKTYIDKIIISLRSTYIADKIYSNGKLGDFYLLKVSFNDASSLLLKIRDIDNLDEEFYLFLINWDDKYNNGVVLKNLIMKNKELKSILKGLNLLNWKNGDK